MNLKSALGTELMRLLKAISAVGARRSEPVYLVGGMVRDLAAKRSVKDVQPDITVVGDEVRFAEKLVEQSAEGCIISESRHRTVKARVWDITLEIATARTDKYSPWGDLPRITAVNHIEEDLPRRDFTMNAIAFSLNADDFGAIIDPLHGVADCKRGVIRVIHKNSFREDPSRMMRGMRFAARYGYRLDRQTACLMERDAPRLKSMTISSPTRVFNEFRLWFSARENTAQIAALSRANSIHPQFIPELHTDEVTLDALRNMPVRSSALSKLALLTAKSSPQSVADLAQRLNVPAEWRDTILDASTLWRNRSGIENEARSNSDIAKALGHYRSDALQACGYLLNDRLARNRIQRYLDEWSKLKPHLNGDDLIEAGVPKGPQISETLNALRSGRIDGWIKTRHDEIEWLSKKLGRPLEPS